METSQAKRIVREYTQHLQAEPSQVFPLLCPVREYEWIEHWTCKMIYSDSGVAEENCIFTTNFPDDGGEDVWVVSHYEPSREIQFVIVNDRKVVRYSITLTDNGDGTTTAVWKQRITALNDLGNQALEHLTEKAYAHQMKTLETMLNHFLTTGEMLKGSRF